MNLETLIHLEANLAQALADLNAEKQRLIEAHSPYKPGDITTVPQEAHAFVGRQCEIKTVTIDPPDHIHDTHTWHVYAVILRLDGSPTSGRMSWHTPIAP